ncbi:putative PhoH family protein [Vibrio phage 424E50-1]|nr:putative PhoH family protein [Vibrio phage 424E50-1]
MKKTFIIDTNVLLSDPQSILKFEEGEVVIPLTVLEELDKQKSSDRDIARDARVAIRQLDAVIRNLDPIDKGVELASGGKLWVSRNVEDFTEATVIKPTCNDDHIINVALHQQQLGNNVVLVSNDVCMRLKAKGIGVKQVQEFSSDVIVDDPELLPQGYLEIPDGWFGNLTQDEVITKSCGEVHIKASCLEEIVPEGHSGVAINDWLVNESEGITARLDGVVEETEDLVFTFVNMEQLLSRKAAGIRPRNVFQAIAMDALLDSDIHCVVIDAAAGSGKTLLGMAAACEMVKGKKASYRMDKVIFTRSNDTQFKEIGFLKGGETEKMAPWLAGCTDNLEIIARESKKKDFLPTNAIDIDGSSDSAFVQFKSLNFMRGRSINHKVLFIDEFQNLTPSQAKTVISRAGEYCKVIITGNLGQIDNDFISPRTSGLTHATEKLHGLPFTKVVRLQGVERSLLAEFVEENF